MNSVSDRVTDSAVNGNNFNYIYINLSYQHSVSYLYISILYHISSRSRINEVAASGAGLGVVNAYQQSNNIENCLRQMMHLFSGVRKQMNRLLKALQRDANETDSDHSGDGSNTDSGRGPSEEGENARTRLMAAANRGCLQCVSLSS